MDIGLNVVAKVEKVVQRTETLRCHELRISQSERLCLIWINMVSSRQMPPKSENHENRSRAIFLPLGWKRQKSPKRQEFYIHRMSQVWLYHLTSCCFMIIPCYQIISQAMIRFCMDKSTRRRHQSPTRQVLVGSTQKQLGNQPFLRWSCREMRGTTGR